MTKEQKLQRLMELCGVSKSDIIKEAGISSATLWHWFGGKKIKQIKRFYAAWDACLEVAKREGRMCDELKNRIKSELGDRYDN